MSFDVVDGIREIEIEIGMLDVGAESHFGQWAVVAEAAYGAHHDGQAARCCEDPDQGLTDPDGNTPLTWTIPPCAEP